MECMIQKWEKSVDTPFSHLNCCMVEYSMRSDTLILHHELLLILVLILPIIPYYHTVLMPFLSKYARYITESEKSGNWNFRPGNREKGRKNQLDPNDLKLYE